MSLIALKKELQNLGTAEKAKSSAWFFKTGPGEYGEGDIFIGLTVPEQRRVAARYSWLSLQDLESLLHSREHEFRLTALLILVQQYKKGDEKTKKKIHTLYLKNTQWVNNWDLVDGSAEYLVGDFVRTTKNTTLLKKLALSRSLWERRISIVATFAYLKAGDPTKTFAIAETLLTDTHDLIHKATGWLLREAGKRCGEDCEKNFLQKHYKKMPRTMLRYAIERFSPALRARYLKGLV